MRVSVSENFKIWRWIGFLLSESKNRAVGRGDAPATLSVPSRAFSIQQTRGRRGGQVWSQWSQALRRGRCGPPRMRRTSGGIGRVDPAVAWQQLRRFLRLSWGAVDQFKFVVLGFR